MSVPPENEGERFKSAIGPRSELLGVNEGKRTEIAKGGKVFCGRESDAAIVVVNESKIVVFSVNPIRTDVNQDSWQVCPCDQRTGRVGDGSGYDEAVRVLCSRACGLEFLQKFGFALCEANVPDRRSSEITEDSVKLFSSRHSGESDVDDDFSNCHADHYIKTFVLKANELRA